jgi:hypothetical protein
MESSQENVSAIYTSSSLESPSFRVSSLLEFVALLIHRAAVALQHTNPSQIVFMNEKRRHGKLLLPGLYQEARRQRPITTSHWFPYLA